MGKNAKLAAAKLALMSCEEKNVVLRAAASALSDNADYILAENAKDVSLAREKGMSEALIDRLSLTKQRILDMSDGILQVSKLPDPVGEIVSENTRPNGILIREVRVPIGVIGIIYESRPNVLLCGSCFC